MADEPKRNSWPDDPDFYEVGFGVENEDGSWSVWIDPTYDDRRQS